MESTHAARATTELQPRGKPRATRLAFARLDYTRRRIRAKLSDGAHDVDACDACEACDASGARDTSDTSDTIDAQVRQLFARPPSLRAVPQCA
jgi:hypothetical protein